MKRSSASLPLLAPRSLARTVVASVTVSLGLALGASAAAPPPPAPPASAPVDLPPMMVEESTSSVPWLYVSAGGTEFLSRCSPGTTRDLVEGWITKMQLLRTIVPEEFLARMDVSEVFILYGQEVPQTMSVEIQRELQARAASRTDAPGGGVNIAPSMRLGDRDMHASIAYVDEVLFDASTMSVSPNHLRYLLQARVPELPAWFTEGLERTYRRTDVVLNPITLGPLVWLSPRESDAVASESTHPRPLLPANELFASSAGPGAENRHARRAQVRAATQELFVRWALATGEPTRSALWKFAHRAALGPVTEEDFEACFGFDYAELRDRLSDYLPHAIDETKRLAPSSPPPPPPIEIERATPNQIARIRGEWERLAIGHVQRRLPQAREPYLAQARRTLRRAYDAGDRDPRLLATMGLCEIDAGNDAGAREFLEPAVARGVVRPRAYFELARLRFATLRRDAPESQRFTYAELAPVFQPLQRALTQAPLLPEVSSLLAEAWAQCAATPSATEFAELQTGAQFFARRPEVARPTAFALARHGQKTAALAVLATCAAYALDDATQAEIARWRAALDTATP